MELRFVHAPRLGHPVVLEILDPSAATSSRRDFVTFRRAERQFAALELEILYDNMLAVASGRYRYPPVEILLVDCCELIEHIAKATPPSRGPINAEARP